MLFWVLKFHNIGLNVTVLKKYVFKICLESNIEPGEYFGKEANKVIRNMQQKLIEHFESRIKQFNRIDIHKKLTEICANTYNSINVHKKRFNSFNNIDETVLNEVQLKTIKDREQEKHNLRVILYFIESNLFLERESKREITQEELNELLAFSNWLVVLIGQILGSQFTLCFYQTFYQRTKYFKA